MEFGFRSKVQEEPYLQICGAEIVEQLAFGGLGSFECRFRLDDEPLVDDHVDTLHRENVSFIRHVGAHLSTDSMTADEQLSLESHRVYVLQKPEAKRVVHLVERPNDGTREPLLQ